MAMVKYLTAKERVKQLRKTLRVITKNHESTTDRLSLASTMSACLSALKFSMDGWSGWTGNFQVIDDIQPEDLVKMEATFYVAIKLLINLDMYMSLKYTTQGKMVTSNMGLVDRAELNEMVEKNIEKKEGGNPFAS